MTKSEYISNQIANEMAKGKTIRSACEAVLGKDVMDAMISELYHQLRDRAPR